MIVLWLTLSENCSSWMGRGNMEAARLLAFWGKTPRGFGDSSETVRSDTERQQDYKPVLHHLIDVAAVALQWQQLNPARLEREAALLKASPECLSKTTAFLAGIHDLGKLIEPLPLLSLDVPRRRGRVA